MKKLLSVVTAAAMVMSFSACGQTAQSSQASEAAQSAQTSEVQTETSEAPQQTAVDSAEEAGSAVVEQEASLVNPITEYNSLEELNQAAGTELKLPDGMEVSNEYFSTISSGVDLIAQYEFTYDGVDYTLRCAPAILEEDISGVYIAAEPAFSGAVTDGIQVNSDETCKVARWANIDGQFTLQASDNGSLGDEDFSDFAQRICDAVNPAVVGEELSAFFQNLAGDWQDQTSGRAVMTVTANEDSADIEVSWADSASENVTWDMTITLSEDGLLYYDNCTETDHTYDEDGNETTATIYTDGSGYFSLGAEDGLLYWDGAADENCAGCVFEQVSGSDVVTSVDVNSEAYTGFADVLAEIYAIGPGSAGSSLRAEEAASAINDYMNTYGEELTVEDYTLMTETWLEGQTSQIEGETPADILREAIDSLQEDGTLAEGDLMLSGVLNATDSGIDAMTE